jgi:serine/threonine protein kinase/Tfp pilus assembly protein PilF
MNQQGLTSERWRQVKEIFQAAVELPAAEREAYLTDICAGDSSLLTEVESLIAAHDEPGSFLDTPAFDLAKESAADALLGKSLGRYRILSLLGRGGMGEIYKAKDTTLGRDVAIKVLSSGFSIDRDRLHRFEQEARAASALNHPNIITIHEFGQEEGVHFIVSEFIEGETLRRRIGSGRTAGERMSAADVLEIGIQVAGALNAAHEAGIVHRDIKPENVMVRPDGLVKVLDFGLAKLIERSSSENVEQTAVSATFSSEATTAGGETGVVMGTVSYMSPEQARGQRLDPRTDLFSLGVALYEMTAGHSPFARATVADTIASILEKEPPPLAQFTAEVPDAMEQIIRKSLSKDREKRYQTARELLDDLKSLKSGETSVASSPAKKEPLTGAIKQRWRSAAIALAAMITVIAAVVIFNKSDKAIESIAVLPFINADGNPETEYLADGVTEGVINTLTQLPNLIVRPRNQVFRYKKREIDPQAAGREMEVETVLTGQVTPRAGQLAISLQLIDARKNRQLWGAKYTGRSGDLPLMQMQIAREITGKLRPGVQLQMAKRHTENAEAYYLYLQGRSLWNQRDREGYRKAIKSFTDATNLDPAFALAHAGLADCYVLGGGYPMTVHDNMSRARASALTALKLDETLGAPHASLAQVQLFYDWNLAEAEASFKRAIALEPDYETAYHWYATMLAVAGRFPAAIDQIKLAKAINPVSPIIFNDAGLIYYYAGQYDLALEECKKALDLSPDFYPASAALGDIYLQMDRRVEALDILRDVDQREGRLLSKAALGFGYALSGQKKKALAILDEMRRASPDRPVPPFYLALLYTGLGQKDAAFKWLRQAYQERAYRMIYLKVDPAFASLRQDPRFDALLRDIGLPPAN